MKGKSKDQGSSPPAQHPGPLCEATRPLPKQEESEALLLLGGAHPEALAHWV